MTTRILPRAEYFRLIGTELQDVRDRLPASACVVAVEDDDGELVGCWALMPVFHAEGVWIAERERKRGRVALRLLRAMSEAAQAAGSLAVFTAATDETVGGLIERLGGQKLPGDHFLMPVGV